MDNDKDFPFEDELQDEKKEDNSASRARNRTVMLTPEVTDEVRTRLAEDPETPVGLDSPRASIPDEGFSGGFVSPGQSFLDSSREAEKPPIVSEERYRQRSSSQSFSGGNKESHIAWRKKGKIVGFLISYDESEDGEFFELRAGRLMVSSDISDSGNLLYLSDDSVSPMHAILRVGTGGEVQILDQLSEEGTRIRHSSSGQEEELSGEKSSLEHGDEVWFGKRHFYLLLLSVDTGENA